MVEKSCKICLKKFTGETPYKQHMISKEHAKNVHNFKNYNISLEWQENPSIKFIGMCTLCNSSIYSDGGIQPHEMYYTSKKQCEDHLASGKHKENFQDVEKSHELLKGHQEFFINFIGVCSPCGSALISAEDIERHIKDSSHGANLLKSKL